MNNTEGIAADHLRSLIERLERLIEERPARADDIAEVMSDAKHRGFDTKAIKKLIQLSKLSPAEYQEQEHMVDLYKHALGMLGGD